jgi:DNA (cytosine-5)-methyltransferase 1
MQILFNKQRFLEKSPDPISLLGDLVDPYWTPGGETRNYPKSATTNIQKELRRDPLTGLASARGALITEHEYANHSNEVMKKFEYMIRNDGEIPNSMKTKKFAQRLLPEKWGLGGPTITATSLPDDYVHFSQPRVLTVREWARLQTFPDWYQFSGKRTTGGRNRAGDPSIGLWGRDLPKYTQIGNAVPVKLASALGKIVNAIID